MSWKKPQSPGIRILALAFVPAAALLALTSRYWGLSSYASAMCAAGLAALYVAVAFSLSKINLTEERRGAVLVVFTGLVLRAVLYALPPPIFPGVSLHELPAGGWPSVLAVPVGEVWARPLLTVLDLVVQVFLVLLLRARGESPTALFAYAWNPVVLLALTRAETAPSFAGLAFLLAALLAIYRGRRWVAVFVWGFMGLLHPFAVLLHAAFWNRLTPSEKRVFAVLALLALTFVAVTTVPAAPAASFNASFWGIWEWIFSPTAALWICAALWLGASALVTRRRPPLMDGFAVLVPSVLLLSPHVGLSWGPWLGMLFVFRPSLPWMVFSGVMVSVLLMGSPSGVVRLAVYGSLIVVSLAQTAWHTREGKRRRHHRSFSV